MPGSIQLPTTPGRPETPPSLRDRAELLEAVIRMNSLIAGPYLARLVAEDERKARLDVVVNEFFAGSGITVLPAMRPFLRRLAEFDLSYAGENECLLTQCVAAMLLVKEATPG